jgi:hypothetical protein
LDAGIVLVLVWDYKTGTAWRARTVMGYA